MPLVCFIRRPRAEPPRGAARAGPDRELIRGHSARVILCSDHRSAELDCPTVGGSPARAGLSQTPSWGCSKGRARASAAS